MYRKAIMQGTPVKYHALVNTVNRQIPKIVGNQYELADTSQPNLGESPYSYYFYPLQTFRHELTNPYGYKTLVWILHFIMITLNVTSLAL